MKHKLVKTSRELAISAADQKEWIKDDNFILAKVPLHMLAIGCAQNLSTSNEVIVDVNKNKLQLGAAFMPKVVVLAGADKVKELRRKAVKHHECWISLSAAKEMKLTAADQAGLGTNQLNQELSALLSDQNKKSNTVGGDYTYSYIVEIYPDQKYFIYSKKGVLWKQEYTFIGKSQLVSFVGSPVRVKITYSEMAASSALVSTTAPVAINSDDEVIKNYGAKTSEAHLGIKTMSNTAEALKMYSEAKDTGKWVPQILPAFPIPKNLVHAAAEALRALSAATGITDGASFRPAGFVVMDFLKWQNSVMSKPYPTKLVQGSELSASQFALVADEKDPSTWSVPIDNVARVKRAYEYTQKHKTQPVARERILAAAEQYNLV